MKPNIVLKPTLAKKFNNAMKNGRIVFFSAPCGCGKSVSARELLKGKNVKEVMADFLDAHSFDPSSDWEVLLIDNLQLLTSEEKQRELTELIKKCPERKFVFLSRGAVPGWLMSFQYAGLMYKVEIRDMFFDTETAAEFFCLRGVKVSGVELASIMKMTLGYPLALAVYADKLAAGALLNNDIVDDVTLEIYRYYDEAVFKRFDLSMRRFLMDIAPFETFNIELARMASGNSRAGEMIASIQQNTTMLYYGRLDNFVIWEVFREFLVWEEMREYSDEQLRGIYSRGALYYELHEDYGRALEYYTKSGEHSKVSELLIKNSQLHPGMGHYGEMERYYNTLKDSEILASPALMQGMSMLESLRMNFEKSEYWYDSLKKFIKDKNKSDAAAKEAQTRLLWLDISLPQRGAGKIKSAFTLAFKMMCEKEFKFPPFSVTSTLPSVMNGGKDFSAWSKADDLLYATMKTPVEAVLGKDGVCLADLAITESKFEKGEDVSGRMLALVSRFSEVQCKGTPDIEFAIAGLLARSLLDGARAEEAKRSIITIRERFADEDNSRFLPNIDALLCRIALRLRDTEYIDEWYRIKAPRDPVNFRAMQRYQYMTQAMVELARGENDTAILTVTPLLEYCRVCARNIDMIHINIIIAIAKERKGDKTWKENLNSALDIAYKYKFVRTLSQYSSALLPLLEKISWKRDKSFFDKILSAVRAQALAYPNFLKVHNIAENLTAAEMQVLRLMCEDKSNAEIGDILNIKLATVKSHVSHILQKLSVSRRSEAKTVAQKLKLV